MITLAGGSLGPPPFEIKSERHRVIPVDKNLFLLKELICFYLWDVVEIRIELLEQLNNIHKFLLQYNKNSGELGGTTDNVAIWFIFPA